MADGTVRVAQAASGDRLIDNEVVTNDVGETVYRQKIKPEKSFVGRLMDRDPAAGYALWLDVQSSSATHIYIMEAPIAATSDATTFRGIRIQCDANGNPLGKVQTVTAGASWDNRSGAGWA